MPLAHTLTPPTRRGEIQRHPRRRMTEDEFVDWIGEKTRAEWIDGEIIMMAPVSGDHDWLGWWLRSLVQHFVEYHGLGHVRGSEFTVVLPKLRQRRMPDVSFVSAARSEIVLSNHIDGAPDLVIEVVSPDSIKRDWQDKFNSYQRAKVREYWIVDPLTTRLEAYTLSRTGKFRRIPESDDGISSIVLPGFHLRARWLFSAARPSLLTILREWGI